MGTLRLYLLKKYETILLRLLSLRVLLFSKHSLNNFKKLKILTNLHDFLPDYLEIESHKSKSLEKFSSFEVDLFEDFMPSTEAIRIHEFIDPVSF
mgnify:CR=1 FL=1